MYLTNNSDMDILTGHEVPECIYLNCGHLLIGAFILEAELGLSKLKHDMLAAVIAFTLQL